MASASTFGPLLSETSQRSPSSSWFSTSQWVSGPMEMADKNTATATLEQRSKPRTLVELFPTGYRSLPKSSKFLQANCGEEKSAYYPKPSLAQECCILRSKPAKRQEKRSRKTGGMIEIAHDSMENPMLGNPIDENTL